MHNPLRFREIERVGDDESTDQYLITSSDECPGRNVSEMFGWQEHELQLVGGDRGGPACV